MAKCFSLFRELAAYTNFTIKMATLFKDTSMQPEAESPMSNHKYKNHFLIQNDFKYLFKKPFSAINQKL